MDWKWLKSQPNSTIIQWQNYTHTHSNKKKQAETNQSITIGSKVIDQLSRHKQGLKCRLMKYKSHNEYGTWKLFNAILIVKIVCSAFYFSSAVWTEFVRFFLTIWWSIYLFLYPTYTWYSWMWNTYCYFFFLECITNEMKPKNMIKMSPEANIADTSSWNAKLQSQKARKKTRNSIWEKGNRAEVNENRKLWGECEQRG